MLGVGAIILPDSYDDPPELELVGRDVPVNEGAQSARDISAHNSPTLARNPRARSNLAVADRVDTPRFSCALHVSFDSGTTWSATPIPVPKAEPAKCYAPDVTFTRDGTLHFAFVTLTGRGNVPNAIWLSSSRDGGRTLSEPNRVHGPLAFQIRLAADTVRKKRLYMTWLQATEVGAAGFGLTGNPIKAIRSDDAGKSWTKPRQVSDEGRERVVTPAPVIGPKGELYVLYLDMGDDSLDYAAGHGGKGGAPYPGRYSLVLTRSLDGGRTWAESVVDRDVRPIHRFVAFFPPAPSVAVDRGGRVYVAFHDRRGGDADVYLWSLAPGKRSRWEGPTRVNDTKERDGTWQYLPKLAVAPDGRLDVLYYDRRADRGRNIMNGVSLQSSADHGKTFSAARSLSSRSFDSRIGFAAKRGLPDLGSRLGLLSDNRFALGLWTDTRAGTPATQKQDLAAAVVAVTKPDRLSAAPQDALRYGGGLLVVLGVGLILSWLVRSRGFASGTSRSRPGESTPESS